MRIYTLDTKLSLYLTASDTIAVEDVQSIAADFIVCGRSFAPLLSLEYLKLVVQSCYRTPFLPRVPKANAKYLECIPQLLA